MMIQKASWNPISCFLISLFFILTPYTWSYVGQVSGFLIRPIDFFALFIIFWGALSKAPLIPKKAFFVVSIFALLLFWLGLNYVVNSDPTAITSLLKISFYLLASVFAARILAFEKHQLPARIFVPILFCFILFVLATNLEILDAIGNLIIDATRNPRRALYGFWFNIYSINFFGPETSLEIVGNSFRNTASLGFLVVAMICFGLLDKENWQSSILVYLFLGLSIISLSRTALFFAVLFLFMTAMTVRNFRSIIILIVALVAGIYFTINSFFIEALNERLGSGFLRGEIWALGIEKLQQAPLWGSGVNGQVLTRSGLQSAHNVVLSLGVEQGIPALIFGFMILTFNLIASFIFLSEWARTRVNSIKRKYQIFTIAALIITVRPFLSASSQNFYSLGEWACFTLMLVGLSFHYSNRLNQYRS